MEPGSTQQFFLLFVFILISSFFSVSEAALTALSKIRLRNMEEEGIKAALKIKKLVNSPQKISNTVLIGRNLANIAASVITALIVLRFVGNDNFIIGISVVILTLALLAFCEIIPKIVVSQKSEQVSILVCTPLTIFAVVFSPIVLILNIITGFFTKILGVNSGNIAQPITELELKTMLNVSHEGGVLEGDERTMINNVFGFRESKAKDVMTPRTDIVAIQYNLTYEEIRSVFIEEGFSRLPVYKENTDDIVGILYFKDFIFSADKSEDFDIEQCMRKPYFTYESKPTKELFSIMRIQRIQVSVVLDEYGGTSGIATLEDLIEEIVGEIEDEFDEYTTEIEVIKEDEYIVEGSMKISDFNEMVGTNLESDDYESVGGFVIGILGKIPKEREEIESDSIKFIIEEIDKNRIEKLRVYT